MKKSMLCMLLAASVCLTLCGCGGMSAGRDNMAVETPVIPENSPDLLPEILPMETPNVEDGIVNDQDGQIDDEDNGSETQRDNLPATPSPEPTANP